jgi:hypothetical protein
MSALPGGRRRGYDDGSCRRLDWLTTAHPQVPLLPTTAATNLFAGRRSVATLVSPIRLPARVRGAQEGRPVEKVYLVVLDDCKVWTGRKVFCLT